MPSARPLKIEDAALGDLPELPLNGGLNGGGGGELQQSSAHY